MNPKVSFVIPTLNAGKVLEACLQSIKNQDYPKEDIEIVIGDGGSTDSTLELAQRYGARVVENRLKTAESGKAVALKSATGEFIALVDSDNVLPDKTWLQRMLDPLIKHPEAAGSEPWEYTWRREDGFIDRYCALIGMNDPLCHFLGNYDRINLLTGKWTEVSHDEKDLGEYLLIKFDRRGLPTIGANGTVFRADFLKERVKGDYLFDIDILAAELSEKGSVDFIKVKNGIIHTFCQSDVKKFSRKQKRRIRDYLYHKSAGDRSFNWKTNNTGLALFVLKALTVFPLAYESVKGYTKKADSAWFFHLPACWITLWQYGVGYLGSFFANRELNREGWGQ